MDFNSENTRKRKAYETKKVIGSFDSIVGSFSEEKNDANAGEGAGVSSSPKYKGLRGKVYSFVHERDDDISREFPQGKLSTRRIISFAYQCLSAWDKICFLLSVIVIAGLGLLIPVLTHIIVSPTLKKFDGKILFSAAIFLCCVCISKIIFEMIYHLVIKRISLKVGSCMRYATMSRVMSLTSETIKDFNKDALGQYVFLVDKLSRKVIESVIATAALSATSLVLLFQVSHYAPTLIGPFLILILVVLLVSVVFVRLKQNYLKEKSHDTMLITAIASSIIRGIKKIKLIGAERRVFSVWADEFAKEMDERNHLPKTIQYYKVIIGVIEFVFFGIFYGVASYTQVSPSNFYVFLTVFSIVIVAINSFLNSIVNLGEVIPAAKNLRPFFTAETETDTLKEKVDSLSGQILISNIKFQYSEDSPLIFDGINLSIEPGQYVAVVGRTGCGKSTLVKLLMGFEKPTQGTIFYDEKDLSSLDIRSVRSNIGAVLQEGKLINGSILENISIANPTIGMREAYKAAEIAGIADDIRAMPMGMHTFVSEETSVISGGQKQRILIARALVNSPNIIIFDEATSALDNNVQKEISKALDEMGVTRIVVAHRLSTIKNADRIIVLENGKIAESGTFEELIEKREMFYKLVEMQRL